MDAFTSWIKDLQKYTPARIEREFLAIVRLSEDQLIDANLDQLMHGQDSNGFALDPPYRSEKYAEFKLILNPLGVVDLKLHGGFHGKWRMTANRWDIGFTSTDFKTKDLTTKYGENIFGVQRENLEEITESYILEDGQNYFRRDVFKL